jgi:hypothetical protein
MEQTGEGVSGMHGSIDMGAGEDVAHLLKKTDLR